MGAGNVCNRSWLLLVRLTLVLCVTRCSLVMELLLMQTLYGLILARHGVSILVVSVLAAPYVMFPVSRCVLRLAILCVGPCYSILISTDLGACSCLVVVVQALSNPLLLVIAWCEP